MATCNVYSLCCNVQVLQQHVAVATDVFLEEYALSAAVEVVKICCDMITSWANFIGLKFYFVMLLRSSFLPLVVLTSPLVLLNSCLYFYMPNVA